MPQDKPSASQVFREPTPTLSAARVPRRWPSHPHRLGLTAGLHCHPEVHTLVNVPCVSLVLSHQRGACVGRETHSALKCAG